MLWVQGLLAALMVGIGLLRLAEPSGSEPWIGFCLVMAAVSAFQAGMAFERVRRERSISITATSPS
jgi:hypothetical protein